MQDSVQCLVGIVGVQGGQYQVTGFGKGNRMLHRLTGPYLADQNYIRCLAKGIAQSNLKRLRIDANFPLGNNAAFMAVYELDRILNGNNMTTTIAIAMANHCRQGSGLTGTGSTHKDNDTALGHHQIIQNWWQ